MALTAKQERFVEEYLIDLNATQAAIRAGYSKKRASELGYQLLRKSAVQAAITAAKGERSRRVKITQGWVLEELRRIAAADRGTIAKVVTRERPVLELDRDTGEQRTVLHRTQGVELTDTDALGAEERAALAGIEETKFGIKVNTYDKVRALELLGKHLGLFDGHGTGEKMLENNLLAALGGTGEEVALDEIPEVQPAAEAGDAVVERPTL